jgi:hypothetical protein
VAHDAEEGETSMTTDPMPAGGRWFRVNTTWSQSEWLAVLAPAARLAWIEVLSHVKAHGFDGRVRAVAPVVFSRMVGIDTTDVLALLAAAQADGALMVDDGHWVITGWIEHQGDPTAKYRMKRYRESRSVTDVTRNQRNVTPTETETSTKTETEEGTTTDGRAKPKNRPWRFVPDSWQPNDHHQQLAVDVGVNLAEQVALFRDHEFAKPKTDADRAFSRWLRTAVTMAPRRNGKPTADERVADHYRRVQAVDLNASRSVFDA